MVRSASAIPQLRSGHGGPDFVEHARDWVRWVALNCRGILRFGLRGAGVQPEPARLGGDPVDCRAGDRDQEQEVSRPYRWRCPVRIGRR